MRYGTQTNIARNVGISMQHMNDILCDRRRPSAALALKLQLETGIDATKWLYEDTAKIRALLDLKYS